MAPPEAAAVPAAAVDNAELVRSLPTGMTLDAAKTRLEGAVAAADPPLERRQAKRLAAAIAEVGARSGSDQTKVFALEFAVIEIAGPIFLKGVFAR